MIISQERVNSGPVSGLQLVAIMVRVENIDLNPIKMKLMLPKPEGKGWSAEQADASILWYRRYLALCALYPDEPLVPNGPIDEVWHMHILDTSKYAKDCHEVFGYFLHHYPYFGLNNDADVRDHMFDRTNELYQIYFGEDCRVLYQKSASNCNHGGGGTGCGQGCRRS